MSYNNNEYSSNSNDEYGSTVCASLLASFLILPVTLNLSFLSHHHPLCFTQENYVF